MAETTPTSPTDEVRLERAAPDRVDLLLDRPAKLNALTLAMTDAVGTAARDLDGEGGHEVLVVRSSTPRAFSVGADITEWAAMSPVSAHAASRRGTAALAELAGAARPVLAALAGHCLGGGLELALACDLRVADRTARLGFPEATLGNATGWGGLGRLVALVGPARAKDLLMTGRIVDAEEAATLGLVDVLVEPGGLDDAVAALVGRLAANAPVALRTIKQAVDALSAPSAAAAQAEALAAGLHAATEDGRRGKDAFVTRTTPVFGGA